MSVSVFSLFCHHAHRITQKASYLIACTVEFGDLKDHVQSLKPRTGIGGVYYYLEFDVILSFGTTELKAFVSWKDAVSALGLIFAFR